MTGCMRSILFGVTPVLVLSESVSPCHTAAYSYVSKSVPIAPSPCTIISSRSLSPVRRWGRQAPTRPARHGEGLEVRRNTTSPDETTPNSSREEEDRRVPCVDKETVFAYATTGGNARRRRASKGPETTFERDSCVHPCPGSQVPPRVPCCAVVSLSGSGVRLRVVYCLHMVWACAVNCLSSVCLVMNEYARARVCVVSCHCACSRVPQCVFLFCVRDAKCAV